MKNKIFFFILAVFLTNFCDSQNSATAKQYPQQIQCDSTWYPQQFITPTEAEKILLCPIFLKDSLCDFANGYLRYDFTYKAKSIDSSTKLKASLFFGLEQFVNIANARKVYAHIKIENQKIGKITDLNEIGDEGFLAKDMENNPFIMLRQSNRIYKLRSLHVTNAQTSFDELMRTAKKIVLNH